MITPSESILGWSEIVAGLGTVFLTAFLVLLYRKQQEQLAANHEAILEVTGVEWYGDKAILFISNRGNGAARRLGLTTLVWTDSGSHRNHILRTNILTRIEGEAPSKADNILYGFGLKSETVIEPGEENVPFHGKSRIGIPDVRDYNGFKSVKFSNFVRKEKDRGGEVLKFTHLVQGEELSGKRCRARLDYSPRGINPQEFETRSSLENPPSVRISTTDRTFDQYFHSTYWDGIKARIYLYSIKALNRIPKISVTPRPIDASGTQRVKRVLLKKRIISYFNKTRKRIQA